MGSHTHIGRGRRGFTIAELMAGLLVLVVLAAVAAPTLAGPRRAARLQSSRDNLRFLGQVSASYTNDFAGLMPAYSWTSNGAYEVAGLPTLLLIPPDRPNSNTRNIEAQQWQNTDILRRLTGRVTGADKILRLQNLLPNRRGTHLVLADYAGVEPNDRRFADPQDGDLLRWQRDWSEFEERGPWPVPVEGDDFQFLTTPMIQRWPYSSSYRPSVSLYSFDMAGSWGLTLAPVSDTCNLFLLGTAALGNRHASEVAFPAGKVFMFEWHDRHSSADDRWYAYPQARPNKVMFDGSVQDLPTGEAGLGFNPNDPGNPDAFAYLYTRLTTEPAPVGDPDAVYPVSYRFTRAGLAGIDYTP